MVFDMICSPGLFKRDADVIKAKGGSIRHGSADPKMVYALCEYALNVKESGMPDSFTFSALSAVFLVSGVIEVRLDVFECVVDALSGEPDCYDCYDCDQYDE